jgi:hypothetical protein
MAVAKLMALDGRQAGRQARPFSVSQTFHCKGRKNPFLPTWCCSWVRKALHFRRPPPPPPPPNHRKSNVCRENGQITTSCLFLVYGRRAATSNLSRGGGARGVSVAESITIFVLTRLVWGYVLVNCGMIVEWGSIMCRNTNVVVVVVVVVVVITLSPLCRVFTLMCLKQTMLLGYTVSQLFRACC